MVSLWQNVSLAVKSTISSVQRKTSSEPNIAISRPRDQTLTQGENLYIQIH